MCVEWCKPSCVDAPYVNRHAIATIATYGRLATTERGHADDKCDRKQLSCAKRQGDDLARSQYENSVLLF
eukprot:COSAG01_NODE_25722_length_735_cov_3.069182_1_plen_70_part_00